jgi:ABC-type bacteriocin/lantibiotic exporter with double-glycine peptidase domain
MFSTLALCLLAAAVVAAQAPPQAYVIQGVPSVAENPNWCGPAALAAVLQYHGEEVSPEEIAEEIYLPDYRGALNLDLLLYARRRGFEAWAGDGSAHQVRRAVSQDRPVICMVRRGNAVAERNHFLVVTGYDFRQGVWTVDSGAGKPETLTATQFDREWSDCGRWMLVVEGRQSKQAEQQASQ